MINQRPWWQLVDWNFLLIVFLIPVCGLVVLYSAGYDPNTSRILTTWPRIELKSDAFYKQLIFCSVSALAFFVLLFIPSKWIKSVAPFAYILGISLLLLVAFNGTIVNGSRRWLRLGGVTLQPAELVKITTIIGLARYLASFRPKKGGFTFLEVIAPVIIIGIPMALILKQPDLGTALAVGSIGGSMLLLVGVRIRVIFFCTLTFLVSIFPLWNSLHPYQQNRIKSLINSEQDPQGAGYHINQSKIAVGSGELFGKGYMQGTQTQLEFLPEHTTDFVFSVLAEEWGFVGCLVVLSLYFFLLLRIIIICSKTIPTFQSLLVFGIGFMIFFHSFVNVGMVIGILPVVGIPLPLFSYGGSSFLLTIVSLGFIARVSIESRKARGTFKEIEDMGI